MLFFNLFPSLYNNTLILNMLKVKKISGTCPEKREKIREMTIAALKRRAKEG